MEEKVFGIVYAIKNRINKKVYVGQTMSHIYSEKKEMWCEKGIYLRFIEHYKMGTCVFQYNNLHVDMIKHGINEFKIKEILRVPASEIEMLDIFESKTIKELNSLHPNGYNVQSNSKCYSKTKKKLMKYFGTKCIRSEEYEKRNERAKHICLSLKTQTERVKFFKNEKIKIIKIVPIKHSGIISEVRVLVYTDKKDTYRIMYSYLDMEKNVHRAKELANHLVSEEQIYLHPELQSILDGKTETVYKYHEKLEMVNGLEIRRITGRPYWHKTSNNYIYLLICYLREDKKNKRIMFGGKNVDIEQSYNDAVEFVEKIEGNFEISLKSV